MSKEIQNLAKDTVIYGLSSMLGRFLNWCLVPLYTYKLIQAQFGEVTNLYAWMSLSLVILTYGMETGFFRFVDENKTPWKTFSTCMVSLTTTSFAFLGLIILFLSPISNAIGYSTHKDYIIMTAIILTMDTICAVPFAMLRYKKKAIKFASLKMLFIFLNIAFNIFFLVLAPIIWKNHPELISWFYNPDYGVGYILVANVLCTFIVLLTLLPEIFKMKWILDYELLKKILRYSFPILILGIAGIMNQTLDKILYPYLGGHGDLNLAKEELGIYGANYKIAIIMVMFTQAFRYAYEPFIFAKNKSVNKHKSYADAMKYFIIFSLFIFLGVIFYLDIIRYFINPKYFPGLKIVPIVMAAQLFFGIVFNLSLWYKLIDKTIWGAYFSILGLAITLAINFIFVPKYGYIACAWAAFVCYAVMMLSSYFVGQHYYPINYNLKSIFEYTLLAVILYTISSYVTIDNIVWRLLFRTILLFIFIAYTIKKDIPLKNILALKRYLK